MADVLALPDELQMIVAWLIRQGEAGLPEVAAFIQRDEAITNSLLADLVAQGFVQQVQVPGEGKGQPSYRVRLVSKRTRKLSLDL